MAQKNSNVSAVARHLFLSPARVRELESEGVFQRIDGKLEINDSRRRYIEHLRQRRPKSPADEKWREERARQLALQNAIRSRYLIPLDDAMEATETTIGFMISELCGMPARITRDLELRRRMDHDIFEMRQRITDKLREAANALEEGPSRRSRQ
jgi:hypothetical protein